MNNFNVFKKEFTKWQNKFGLNGYSVYFKYEPLEHSFAQISVDHSNMAARVSLNSEVPKEHKEFIDIKKTALHEAIHLLTGKLKSLAEQRYVSEDEVYSAEEELVVKLQNLIN